MKEQLIAFSAEKDSTLFFMGLLIIVVSFGCYKIFETCEFSDKDKHNKAVDKIARLIIVGLSLAVLGLLRYVLTVSQFWVAWAVVSFVTAYCIVFVDKLPIWEER